VRGTETHTGRGSDLDADNERGHRASARRRAWEQQLPWRAVLSTIPNTVSTQYHYERLGRPGDHTVADGRRGLVEKCVKEIRRRLARFRHDDRSPDVESATSTPGGAWSQRPRTHGPLSLQGLLSGESGRLSRQVAPQHAPRGGETKPNRPRNATSQTGKVGPWGATYLDRRPLSPLSNP